MNHTTGPRIDRSIYAMPMFVTFGTSDFPLAEAIYGIAGFVPLATIPGPDGTPSLVHLRREKYQDILLVTADGEPHRGRHVSVAADGIDLAELAKRFKDKGVEHTDPTDTPWFTTDLSFTDSDGNTVTLTSPRASEYRGAASWVSEHITGDFTTDAGPGAAAEPASNERAN
jgi:hypothetical protein